MSFYPSVCLSFCSHVCLLVSLFVFLVAVFNSCLFVVSTNMCVFLPFYLSAICSSVCVSIISQFYDFLFVSTTVYYVTQSVLLKQRVLYNVHEHCSVLSICLAFLSSVWLSFWPEISDFNAGWKPRYERCGESWARYWQHLDYWGKQGRMYPCTMYSTCVPQIKAVLKGTRQCRSVAKFIVPEWGLSYWPASLCQSQPYPPSLGTINLATNLC